jgi:hypothetical protein
MLSLLFLTDERMVVNGISNGYTEKHVKREHKSDHKDKHRDKEKHKDRHKDHKDKEKHRDKEKQSSGGKVNACNFVHKVVKAACSGICELSLISVYECLLCKAGMHQMLLYSVTEMILMVVQLFVKVGQSDKHSIVSSGCTYWDW